ncbi:MAG: porin [Candidatus Glassbacteria bacterium]|nr:porin [Candidatus Glassbacteria bacterium]
MRVLTDRINVVLLGLVVLLIQTGNIYGQGSGGLYEQKCGRCHDLFEANEYSAEEWPGQVRAMRVQSALIPDQYEEIVNYLVNAAREEESSYIGKVNWGGYLYTEYFHTEDKAKNFDLHYLNFTLSGWASEKINFIGEFELEHGGTGGSNTFVEEAYIDYWFVPNLGIKVGAMLTPFNRFDEFHAPLMNYTVTRPQISREIGVSAWKDVGVDLHGYLNFDAHNSLSFDLYTINGLGDGSRMRNSRQYRDNNEDKAIGARVNLTLQDALEVGFSVYNGAWDDAGDYDLTMVGGHVMLHTSLVDLYGEFASASSENPTGVEDGDMSGYFIQASKLINKVVRPTVRYGKLDYLDPGSALGRSARDTDLNELVLCLGIYPNPRVVLKIEYQIFGKGSRASTKTPDQLGLQFAVRF